ncbi:MAG TPA: hypothetical protein VMT62_07280 [Syntrophorhabdaceae bacterium]|nr:hypothetical protein [Syntrophorhabdaceae bacterium]
MKKSFVSIMLCATIVALLFSLVTVAPAMAQATMQGERGAHPRIVKAIHALEDAIAYMKAAPHDFGGHREDAIRDSEQAVRQLREALKYREVKDENRLRHQH